MGGFLIWGVYTEFNPTPAMVTTTQTAQAEGQVYNAMEQNSAADPPLPVVSPVSLPVSLTPAAKVESSGKNERHGDGGRAKDKARELIKELEKKLDELRRTQGPRSEKLDLEKRIKQLKKDAARKAKGEEHSRANKR